MEHGFEPHPSGAVIVLSEAERALLISLGRQALAMLRDREAPDESDPLAALVGIGVQSDTPEDPVLARLLPAGYAGEAEAREFRRFTEREVLRSKIDAAQSVLDTLQAADQVLVVESAMQQPWLTFVNDLRLALGTRLDVREETMEELSGVTDDDPRLPMLLVYDWLTFVQGSLVEVLVARLPQDPPD